MIKLYQIIPLVVVIVVPAAYGDNFVTWPAAAKHVLSGKLSVIEHDRFKIVYTIPDDPDIQVAGGSGGPIALVELHSSSGEKVITFTAQSVGGRLLEDFQGYPQFEIWSRAGGGFWCRSLYKFVENRYCRVKTDEFNDHKELATRTDITASLPGETARLYYVETRLNLIK